MTAPLIMPLGTEDAFPLVNNAYDKWSGVAYQAFAQAQQYAGQLANIPLTPVTFDATFNPQIALGGFPTIAAPPTPTEDLKFNAPGDPREPPSFDAPVYNPGSMPEFDVPAPNYTMPAPPTLAPLTSPGAAPALAIPEMPDAPTIALPTAPDLGTIEIPSLPVFDLPQFTATPPVMDIAMPSADFSFVPAPFNDDLMQPLKDTISKMLQGDFILPSAAIDAIRARAQRAANMEESRGVDTAYAELAARGFAEPPGQLHTRVQQARDNARLARSETNRDVYIQDQTAALENLRAGVAGGIQLEGSLAQLSVQENELQLNAAKYAMDVTMQLLTARIGLYNAQLQGFAIAAQVYRDKLQGALAQVQIYQTEMEAAKIRGELNAQQVELYNAKLRGVQTAVEIYTAQVQGAEVRARANLAVIQGFSAQVQAFTAQVGAQTAQWDGYKAQVQAQLGTVQYYQTAVQAYGERVRAAATGEQVKQASAELQLKSSGLQLDAWRSSLQLFQARTEAEVERIKAVAMSFGAETDVYKANAQIAEAAASFDERRFQLNLAQEQAIVETSLKRSEASFEQMKFFTTMLVEMKKTLATVQSQLAASAMTAVNIGAHVSSSGSQSIGWSTSVGISESGSDF